MASGSFPFTGLNALDQGATWKPTMNWYDTDPDLPFDLTGWTGVLMIKDTAKAGTVLLEVSTSNGYMTLTGTNPNISINAPASVTADMDRSLINSAKDRLFVYDLFLTAPSTEVSKLLTGPVEVIASVSV